MRLGHIQSAIIIFLNEIKVYSIENHKDYFSNKILKIYGISQNPDTKEYIMVLDYAKGGNFNDWMDKNYNDFNMGLCGEVNNIDQNQNDNIYGVIPYVAPEVLKGKPYTQAADIYSFVLNICNGVRPKINVPKAPKCYIDLMKKCLDSNPDNRPKATEILKFIRLFIDSYKYDNLDLHHEIAKQFKEAEEYRITRLSSDAITLHPQAIYKSRLLYPFTKNLPNYDIDNNTVEVIDFTKLVI
ncbi:kinase-like domain-containing protein [Rhizophagus clarus]|uniref:Kinase-like domain-containing protein n=1 Tax=Rhizophagus clarus TaxID=94130 RepID=A0A8H3LRP4_9GLOM|nr:kinase-like domain-containing protein [Rhizophagus clarus]